MKIELISFPENSIKKKITVPVRNYKLAIKGGDVFDDLTEDDEEVQLTHLFEENTMMDIKRFLYVNEKIPIEYQYIECPGFDDKFYFYEPLDANIRHMRYPIDINAKQDSEIDGIPIDLTLLNNRSNYQIRDVSFKKISVDYVKVYDLRDVLKREAVRHFINKDRDNFSTFYKGFVEKFFPMVLFDDFTKKDSWYSFAQSIRWKLAAMQELNNVKPNVKSTTDIKSINLSFRQTGPVKLFIMQMYNSVDLDVLSKIEAYLPVEKKFFMKVLKSDDSSDLSESTKGKLAYIKLFLEENWVKVYENNDIEAFVQDQKGGKARLLSLYKSILKTVNDIFPMVDIKAAVEHSKIKGVGVVVEYDMPPSNYLIQSIRSNVEKFEPLEIYKISQAAANKDNIVIFTGNPNFSISNFNEYESIKGYLSHNKMISGTSFIKIYASISSFVVEFENLKYSELDSKKKLVDIFFSNLNLKKPVDLISKKQIFVLKQTDPVLFNNNKIIYSRLCQADMQPSISNKNDPKAVKFWNFSKAAPEYYACNNKKYKHLKFLTGHHPEGFCLPCCKKKSVENTTVYKKKHDTCLAKYQFDKNELDTKQPNRYISIYSAKIELEENKLMRLSNTLKKFIETPEVFIVGIKPFESTVTSYVLTCLSMILFDSRDKQIDVLVQMITLLTGDPSIFYSIVEGALQLYFTYEEFMRFMNDLLEFNLEKPKWVNFIDWEEVFTELGEYLNVGITYLIEEDNGSVTDSQIFMKLAKKKLHHLMVIKRLGRIIYPLAKVAETRRFNMGIVNDISMKQIESIPQRKESTASFANELNQVYAQCFEGKYVKTVNYFHAVESDNVYSGSLEQYVNNEQISKENIPEKISKWIKVSSKNLIIGVAESCMYFVALADFPVDVTVDTADTYSPSVVEIKESLYFTNMYNLLLLHANRFLLKSINKKMRNAIRSKPLSSLKMSESDFGKIKYHFDLYGNYDFLENERFDFDDTPIDASVFVTLGDPKIDEQFDFGLQPCVSSNYYCDKDKFVLQNPDYLKLLEEDMKNPYKMEYIRRYKEIKSLSLYIRQQKNSKTIVYEA